MCAIWLYKPCPRYSGDFCFVFFLSLRFFQPPQYNGYAGTFDCHAHSRDKVTFQVSGRGYFSCANSLWKTTEMCSCVRHNMWSSSIRKLLDKSLLLCLQNHLPINGQSLTGYLLTLSTVSILRDELVICAVKLIILTGNSCPKILHVNAMQAACLECRQLFLFYSISSTDPE